MKVAYVVNQYPKVSHSFIRREILAIERQAIAVMRIAVRGWDAHVVDEEDIRERGRTRYVLRDGVASLVAPLLREALRSPARFFSTLRLAVHMSRKADRGLAYHLIYFAEACKVAAWLRTDAVDHLHAHFGTNSAEVAMLAHGLTDIPYSFTVHGSEEFDKPEYMGLGEKIRRSAFVVAITSYTRSQLYRWVDQAHWHKVQIVHCGLDRAFHDVPAVPVPAVPRLVNVGRLCEQKGQLLLVEAAAKLASEGMDFELVLAGDGEMRPAIEVAIARHGLQRQVRITGWISSADVRAEILAARALVMSSFAEGLPVVIMEAMALRRPVLTTHITGIPELVLHGENGWLFPPGALTELAAAMKACLTSPLDTLDAMGARARQRVLERHDIDREAQRLADLFRRAGDEITPGIAA